MTSEVKLVYCGVFKKRVQDVEVVLHNPEAMLGDRNFFGTKDGCSFQHYRDCGHSPHI